MPGYYGSTQVPPKRLLLFQHDEGRAWQLLGQVIGAADAGDAGADDQHVEMLDLLRGGMVREGAVTFICFNLCSNG
jgi:hypothetical protein